MSLQNKRFSYAWVIVFICALLMFLSGFVGGYQGQWLSAVTEGLNLSRTSFSLSNTCRYATTAIMNMVFLFVFHRLGVKKTLTLGFVFAIAAFVLYSTANKVWMFYVAGTAFGIGLSFGFGSIVSILLKQWVREGFGTIMGVVMSCSGLGAAVGVQVISPLLFQEGHPLGFRDAYKLCCLILIIAAVLVIALARENKESEANAAKVNAAVKKASGAVTLKGFMFFVVICVFLCSALLMGINSIYAAHMRDVGINEKIVTWATSTLSVMLILSTTSVGVVFDKSGLRLVLIICQMATIIGFALMTVMNAQADTIAIIFAIVFPFALPLETIVVPLIVEGLFDRSEYIKVLGYTTAASNIGFAIGPLIVNKVYDAVGNYLPAIYVCMGLMAVILVAFQIVITVANKKKNVKECV